ncbi:hypothetical protein PLICRDRAFT_114618 [Plicaturopsis crispa FD-325 SS-3]|nr:hypothetical protein PLICRDRAFT_114618 [Plicaturopsis crispa FD-325 SS-3]
MVKHSRKRQKISEGERVDPLGARQAGPDDADKDDEERRLESFLFGVPFTPSGKGTENILVIDDQSQLENDLIGRKELQNLTDTDLFYVDDGADGAAGSAADIEEDVDREDESEADDDDDIPEDGREKHAVEPEPGEPIPSKARHAPAWTDPDDTTLHISLAADKRLRKLRDAVSEDAVGGREYERRLRRQFEKINPTPDWAANARKRARRSTGADSDGTEDDDAEAIDRMLSSTAGVLGGIKRVQSLEKGTLAIERLRDANQAAKAEGEIKAIQFHPSPRIPVLLTASADRRARLFNIDGLTNPHLQTLHIPELPLTNAIFHPSGSSVLLTGPRPFYYSYDLQSGTTHRSPRGLWGTTFSDANNSVNDASMETCAFNSTGEVLAVAGRRGYVHLVDWKSGAGQVVGSLKMNAGVKSLWWTPHGELMSLGDNAEVYTWDVRGRRCARRWQDEGGFGSQVLTGDRGGNYLAVGSNTGLVNVYSSNATVSSNTDRPTPLKTIGNLTTSISTMRFNHDAQLLAIASKTKKDQMRMIHLPSLTAFGNWPTSSTPLGHVSAVEFSAGSEYVAVGNNRGRVLLYHLRDFGAH